MLMQGIFSADELPLVEQHRFQMVVHRKQQLEWILAIPMATKIKVWVKVNTGMQRLGFQADELPGVIKALLACPWIDDELGLMTHLACADEPESFANQMQLQVFNALTLPRVSIIRSIANSAAILSFPDAHADVVRPGIMLYGVSPFAHQSASQLGLRPVMKLSSAVTTIHHYPAHTSVGYGGTWQSDKPSIIGVIPVGYGDGYPRHIAERTPTWVNGFIAPIVGRVSMDMLTIDLTDCPSVKEGDRVELWGEHIPIETIATSAGTIAYELLCQMTSRAFC